VHNKLARILCVAVVALPAFACAYDIDDRLSIGGVLAGAAQYQALVDSDGADDKLRGALPFQPEVSFRPTAQDEVFFKLGFAVGNGLNKVSPFALAPWAADLEDDVKDINGRNRDYLLTAWYKHSFRIGKQHTLGLTGGIIDGSDYVDQNAYAEDDMTQFMNEALSNGNFFTPAYDAGGALEWDGPRLSLRGVVMNVGQEDGPSLNYLGGQLGYKLNTSLGEGNYRALLFGTSADIKDPSGEHQERRQGLLLSFDQQLGDTVGGFLRFGWQNDDAAVPFNAIYSGGLDIGGRLWGRPQDNMGLAYAYLNGGSLEFDYTHLAEAYARFVLNDYFALTADLQYMKDRLKDGGGPEGFIPGLRLVAQF